MPALKFLNWLSHVSSRILNKHFLLYNFGRTVGNMGILSCRNLAQMFGINFVKHSDHTLFSLSTIKYFFIIAIKNLP